LILENSDTADMRAASSGGDDDDAAVQAARSIASSGDDDDDSSNDPTSSIIIELLLTIIEALLVYVLLFVLLWAYEYWMLVKTYKTSEPATVSPTASYASSQTYTRSNLTASMIMRRSREMAARAFRGQSKRARAGGYKFTDKLMDVSGFIYNGLPSFWLGVPSTWLDVPSSWRGGSWRLNAPGRFVRQERQEHKTTWRDYLYSMDEQKAELKRCSERSIVAHAAAFWLAFCALTPLIYACTPWWPIIYTVFQQAAVALAGTVLVHGLATVVTAHPLLVLIAATSCFSTPAYAMDASAAAGPAPGRTSTLVAGAMLGGVITRAMLRRSASLASHASAASASASQPAARAPSRSSRNNPPSTNPLDPNSAQAIQSKSNGNGASSRATSPASGSGTLPRSPSPPAGSSATPAQGNDSDVQRRTCPDCNAIAKDLSTLRTHINEKRHTVTEAWLAAATSGVCWSCGKVCATLSGGGGLVRHGCASPALSADKTKITTPYATFKRHELGASYLGADKMTMLPLRCGFLSLVFSANPTLAGEALHAAALDLENKVFAWMLSPAADESIPKSAYAAMNYSAATRVQHVKRKGDIDNFELMAASALLGKVIVVLDVRPDGSVTAQAIRASGVPKLEAIFIIRENVHFNGCTTINNETATTGSTAPQSTGRNPAQRRTSVGPPRRRSSLGTTQPALSQASTLPDTQSLADPPAKKAYACVKDWLRHVATLFSDYGKLKTIVERRALAPQLFNAARARPHKKRPTNEIPDDVPAYAGGDDIRVADPNRDLVHGIEAAIKELAGGHVARGLRKLTSSGVLELSSDVEQRLKSKYPTPSDPERAAVTPPSPPAPDSDAPPADPVVIERKNLISLVNSKSRRTGAGIDGWSYGLLKDVLQFADSTGVLIAVADGLTRLANDIANNLLTTPELYEMQTNQRGIALKKNPSSNDPRPIGIVQLFVSMASALALRLDHVQELVAAAVGDTELMHGIAGGVESLPHIINAYFSANKNHCVLKVDCKNAFNSVSRAHILHAVKNKLPALLPLVTLLYTRPSKVLFQESRGVDPDGNTKIHSVTVNNCEGVIQGEPLAALLFSIVLADCKAVVKAAFPSVTMRGIADDVYFCGPGADVVAASKLYKIELSKVGLTLLEAKSVLYKPYDVEGARAAAGASGLAVDTGIMCAGVPVGDQVYVQAALANFVTSKIELCEKIRALWKTMSFTSKSVQNIYRIIRFCVSPACINHLLRGVAPGVIKQQLTRFDDAVYKLTIEIFGSSSNDPDCAATTPEGLVTGLRVRLRARDGGLGIGSGGASARNSYVGSLCLTLHLVAKALGPAFTSDAAKTAFPDLVDAESSLFPSCDALKESSIASLLAEPVGRVQRALAAVAGKAMAVDVLSRVTDASDRAFMLSGCNDGATWLDAHAPPGTKPLTDRQYVMLARARLGLGNVDGFSDAAPQSCPACEGLMRSGRPLGDHVTRLRRTGTHALHCLQVGAGGFAGKRTKRHTAMRVALVGALAPAARPADRADGFPDIREPVVTNYYPYKNGIKKGVVGYHGEDARADIAVNVNGPVLLDLVVTHPVPSTNPATANVAGAAASSAYTSKLNHYSSFDIPVGKCVPLSFETGGCIEPRTITFLKNFVKYGLATGNNVQPIWDAATRVEYNMRLRSICVNVSLMIARSVADTLIAGSTVLASRVPGVDAAVPAGPAGGA
jgi:hypothetical protein